MEHIYGVSKPAAAAAASAAAEPGHGVTATAAELAEQMIAAQPAAARELTALLIKELQAVREAHALEREAHADTRVQLHAAQQQVAGYVRLIERAEQDMVNMLNGMYTMRRMIEELRADNKAADRLAADTAALRQQLASSHTSLQQQRQAAAAAQSQASASGLACVGLAAQLRTTQQQQRTLEQQLEQARSELEQAAAAEQALRERLQRANSATFEAQQALAAERTQRSMTVVQQAAQQQAADCIVQVTRVASHGRGSSKHSSNQAATSRARTAVSSGGHPAYRVGLKVCEMVSGLLCGLLRGPWV
jgi:chromosome segregation ATPase